MTTIKTNYKFDSKLVLTNDENNVVAIINVPIGADITKQVRLAIKEDLCLDGINDVELVESENVDEFAFNISIDFKITDEDGYVFTKEFFLSKTAEY